MNASMPDLLKAILEASWQGSLVIVLILLLRPVLGLRVPARWRYLLWTLAVLRLLVPAFVLPPSPASMQNLPVVARPLDRVGLTADPGVESRPDLAAIQNPKPAGSKALSSSRTVTAAPASNRLWWQIAAAVWAAGSVLMVLWIGLGTLRLRRQLRRESAAAAPDIQRLWELCGERVLGAHGRRRQPRLIQTSAIQSPALVGIFRPALLIPPAGGEELSVEDWEHVFLHELAHFRRRDHWTQALQLLALCVHWFNPLVWLGFRYLRADRELAADESALRWLAGPSPLDYGQTLLKILSGPARHPLALGFIGILEDSAQMKQRLRHIVAFTPRRTAGSVVGLLLVVGLAAIILTAAQAQNDELAGWSVTQVSIPKDADIKEAYVELQSPAGRKVTLTRGYSSTEGVTLAGINWTGSPIHAAVTLKKGNARLDLAAEASLISTRADLRRKLAQVEIQAKFLEIPDSMADGLQFPASELSPDKSPALPTPPQSPGSPPLRLRAILDDPATAQFLKTLLEQKGAFLAKTGGTDPSPEVLRVSTGSGQRAVLEVIREMRSPTDWSPPDEKEPRWMPISFETRNIGLTLHVSTTLREGESIDLDVQPQVCEFLGFADFETGVPLWTATPDQAKSMTDRTFVLPENADAIKNRPVRSIFSTRQTKTSLSLRSRQTLVFMGKGETEDTKTFTPPSATRQLVILIRARIVEPDESSPDAFPGTAEPASTIAGTPVATAVVGKPGFVVSPHAPTAGYIDVRGFPSGTEVKDPYTGKIFRVP